MQMPTNPQMEQMPPPPQSWAHPPPQSFPQNAGGGPTSYGASPHFMPPPRQHDNYYAPPAGIPPPLEKQQPHQGISAYGREAPMAMTQSMPSVITQVIITYPIFILYF